MDKKAMYDHFRSMGYKVCQTTNKLIKKLHNDLKIELLPMDNGTMMVVTFDETYVRLFDYESLSVTDFESKAAQIYSALRKF
jgi:uncharacterized protein YegL